MRILCLFYLIKLENLLNLRIKIKQINLIKLKLNLTITLILLVTKLLIRINKILKNKKVNNEKLRIILNKILNISLIYLIFLLLFLIFRIFFNFALFIFFK